MTSVFSGNRSVAETLTFADGAYKIEAILGFPVLSELGRLAFSGDKSGGKLTFSHAAARPPVPASQANLFVESLTPKIIACIVPQRSAIQFALDSGANRTSLRPLFAKRFPSLVSGAAPTTTSQSGVGGTVQREKRIVTKLDLDFAGAELSLRDFSVSAEEAEEAGDHGRLGQDVLRAKGGYVLDFTHMRFELGVPGRADGYIVP